jgi:AcrR family transcriptional regulator
MAHGTTGSRPRCPADERREARQEEILDAAVQLFAEHGYSDTDTQQLVEKLQVGKGTLYRYFPSKRELFLAAADRVVRRLICRIDAACEGVADPLDRLAVAIGAYLAFFAEHPEFVELLMQERALFKDRQKPTYFEHRAANCQRWQALYRDLMAQGRIREMPPDRITDVIGDLLLGTISTNYYAGPRKSPETQAREIIDFVFHGLLTDEERRRRAANERSHS